MAAAAGRDSRSGATSADGPAAPSARAGWSPSPPARGAAASQNLGDRASAPCGSGSGNSFRNFTQSDLVSGVR